MPGLPELVVLGAVLEAYGAKLLFKLCAVDIKVIA